MRRRRSLEKDGDGNGSEKDSDKLQGERGWHTVSCLGGFSLCSPMRDTPPAATRSAHVARVRARFSLANWSSFAICLSRWILNTSQSESYHREDLAETRNRSIKVERKICEINCETSCHLRLQVVLRMTHGMKCRKRWQQFLLLAKWSVHEVLIKKNKLDSLTIRQYASSTNCNWEH